MKKQISFKSIASVIFLAFFVMMSNLVLANGINGMCELQKHSDKKFTLNMDYDYDVNLQVRIIDKNLVELHKEKISDKKLTKLYNLKNLPEGSYFMEIEDGYKITEWKLEVSDEDLNISKAGEINIPKLVQKNDKVELKLQNNNISNASVKIIDGNGIELYKEDLAKTDNVNKIFDFSQVPSDESYIIITSIGKRNFRYYINE